MVAMSRKAPDCCRFNYVVSQKPLKGMIGTLELPEDHALITLLSAKGAFRKNPVETVGCAQFRPSGEQTKHSLNFPEHYYPPQAHLAMMLEAASKYAREASEGTK